MGVFIKSMEEIERIRQAARIVARSLEFIRGRIEAGMSTRQMELMIDDFIRREGGVPAFKGYRGFPGSACISVNDEVVHGIPDQRTVDEGDVVKIDVGVRKDGMYADGAKSYILGAADPRVETLVRATEEALERGIERATAGNRVSDISHAVERHVRAFGFSVVRELSGHGIGIELHEDPQIPNYGPPGRGMELAAGMTICIEPMVTIGSGRVKTRPNRWTVVTADGSASAHFEHTVLVGEGAAEILTRLN